MFFHFIFAILLLFGSCKIQNDEIVPHFGRHTCSHDHPEEKGRRSLSDKNIFQTWVNYKNHPMDREAKILGYTPKRRAFRSLLSATSESEYKVSQPMCLIDGYDNLRIHLEPQLEITEYLTTEKRDYLTNNILPNAKQKISSLLSVSRTVDDVFYISRPSTPCASTWGNGNCQVANTQTCGYATIQSEHMTPMQICTGTQTNCAQEGDGFQYTDVVIYITAQHQGSCTASGSSTLAFASTCSRDQFSRPVVGYANFCPNQLDPDADYFTQKSDVTVTIHEIFHALGFSSSSFGYYKKHDGSSYATIQQTTTERGNSVTKIVTDTAKAVAKWHFNCSSMTGIEIEDGGGSGTAGSHPEMRIYQTEFMTGVLNPNAVFSHITLAIMQDSGWYKANFHNADYLLWGKNQGCDFALEKCLGAGDRPKNTFCTENLNIQCTNDRRAVGVCSVYTWTADLPSYFQYFDDPAEGGAMEVNDYCPLYNQYSVSGSTRTSNCKNIENTDILENQFYGEEYGPNSACFENNLVNSYLVGLYTDIVGKCYRYSCIGTDSVKIFLAGGFSAYPSSIICHRSEEGELKGTDGPWLGSLVCPNIDEICPEGGTDENSFVNQDSCPNSCSGHGTCKQPCTCECDDGYGGYDCSYFTCNGIASNEENVCNGHGTCTGIDTCVCDADWNIGSFCQDTTCYSTSAQSSSVCSGQGKCTGLDTCECDTGYIGQECQLDANQYTCPTGYYGSSCVDTICYGKVSGIDSTICNGGTCTAPDTCDCTSVTGYGGDQCDERSCFGTFGAGGCSNHGKCTQTDICECEEGYYDVDCSQYTCNGLLPTDPTVCNGGRGTCSSFDQCTSCDPGYYGSDCQYRSCFTINGDDETVCSGNGECTDVDTCTCFDGYQHPSTGNADCSVFDCSGVSEDGQCGDYGTCTSPDTCECQDGYGGFGCNVKLCTEFCELGCDYAGGLGLCNYGMKSSMISIFLTTLLLLVFL